MGCTREKWADLARWNWDGDEIVHECIVPSSRRIPGRRRSYDIDVRRFLVTRNNEVVRRAIRKDVKSYLREVPCGCWETFRSRAAGSFDHRVTILSSFVADRIAHRPKKRDPWLFPDETLAAGAGDCEDRALLLASLMLASGISSFNLRVVLGQIARQRGKRRELFDHVWVMYKNESGRWTLVDPVPTAARAATLERSKLASRRRVPERLEYLPIFLFNDHHLWIVRQRREAARSFGDFVRREWKRLDPQFVGEVHLTILEKALQSVDEDALAELTQAFHRPVLGLFGPIVDDIDRRDYDPVEHFDNGYILAGWQRVDEHLAAFRADNRAGLGRFALAAHGIADFYAHSSYAHFHSGRFDMAAYLSDPQAFEASLGLEYASGTFDLRDHRFSVNRHYFHGTREEAAALWNGRLLSGRYAQEDDTQGGVLAHLFMEGVTWIPQRYLDEPDFATRGALPHHNEIAVDEKIFDPTHHKLYRDRHSYRQQFRRRKQLAIAHVRAAFLANLDGAQ